MDLKSTYNKIAGDWFKDHKQDTCGMKARQNLLLFYQKVRQYLILVVLWSEIKISF